MRRRLASVPEAHPDLQEQLTRCRRKEESLEGQVLYLERELADTQRELQLCRRKRSPRERLLDRLTEAGLWPRMSGGSGRQVLTLLQVAPVIWWAARKERRDGVWSDG